MLSFLSNRATAAHLALAAVAPLVLCKYFGSAPVCPVIVWLSLLVAVWAFMAPVKGEDEHSPEARHRMIKGITGDPFVWVSVALLGYFSIAALNDGVALSYDVESSVWALLPPKASLLPGGVAGRGGVFFAVAVLALFLYPGVVYSLDSRQAIYFAVFASVVVVLDALLAYAAGIGIPAGSAVAYGLWAMIAAAAMFAAERNGQRSKELLAAVALAGCLTALLFTGRGTVIAVFSGAIVLLALAFAVCCFRRLRVSGALRALLLLVVAGTIAAAIYHWRVGSWEVLVPVWQSGADETLTRLANATWETRPWLGVGTGAFPLAVKMNATAADWAVLGPLPDFYSNGWRSLLVERGMIGVLAVAAMIGSLAFAWYRRVRLRGREYFSASAILLPIALIAVAGSMVFDGSALHAESLAALVSLAALSVNGGT